MHVIKWVNAMSQAKHKDKKTLFLWTATFSLATCLIYALYYLASSLSLHYFVLSNRGMVEKTVTGNVLSGSLDVAVWGIAIFILLFWLGHDLGLNRNSRHYRSSSALGLLVLLCGLAVGVFLVVLGLVGMWSLVLISDLILCLCFVFATNLFGIGRLVLFLRVLFGGLLILFFVELAGLFLFNVPIALGLNVRNLGLHWGGVELDFANLAYPFLPYVYLLLVVFGLGAYVFRVFPIGWLRFVCRDRVRRLVDCLNGVLSAGEGWRFGVESLLGHWVVVLAVVVSAVVSCLFVVFTILPWNNPTGMMVSVDSPVYYDWISHMRSVDVYSALSFAFGNDRAVFLVLFYALSFVAPLASVIQFAAALLLVLLAVVSVFVLQLFTSSRKVWVLGALLVPFSFQGLGLIYSGYFANMLSLILIFVYVVLFFKLLEKWSGLGFFVLLSVSVLVLFSHSWTWFVFAISLALFLFLEWRLAVHNRDLRGRFRDKAVLVVATVGVGVLVDLLRKVLSPVSSSGSVVGTIQSSLGFPNPAYLLSGLSKAVNFVLGGVFANQLLVALAFVGFLVLLRFKSEVSNFFVAWVYVACVSILFAADDLVFNRALFLLPWIVLLGLGLSFVINFAGSRISHICCMKDWRLWLVLLVLGFVFLVLLNSSFRFLFNINIW
jgi:hypothetical protein